MYSKVPPVIRNAWTGLAHDISTEPCSGQSASRLSSMSSKPLSICHHHHQCNQSIFRNVVEREHVEEERISRSQCTAWPRCQARVEQPLRLVLATSYKLCGGGHYWLLTSPLQHILNVISFSGPSWLPASPPHPRPSHLLLMGHSGEYGNKRHLGTWKN